MSPPSVIPRPTLIRIFLLSFVLTNISSYAIAATGAPVWLWLILQTIYCLHVGAELAVSLIRAARGGL